MKLIRRLKRRKGFTLTELIVAIALIAILMAMVATFSQPVQKMTDSASDSGESLKINEVIGNYLERRLAYADHFSVIYGTDLNDTNIKPVYEQYQDYNSDSYVTKYDEGLKKSIVVEPGYSKYQTTTGMIVIHFNNVTVSGEEYTSSFDVFDIPITYKTNLVDAKIPEISDYSGNYDAFLSAYDAFKDKYGIFKRDIFGKFQYFISMDKNGFGVNKITHKPYMSLIVHSYDFDVSGGIKASDVTSYYDYIGGLATNPLEALGNSRTGRETISFSFENVKPLKKANGTYESTISNPPERGKDATKTDIVIFYNVRDYDGSNYRE